MNNRHQTNGASTQLSMATIAPDVASKYFQLEEMEDKDSCVTEIYLASDKTISFGETDGPSPLTATGSWEITDDGNLKMTINRSFSAGQPETHSTDMGEFNFKVERNYIGQVEKIGELVGFSGSIHQVVDQGDAQVGFFEMVDTTEAKLEDEGRK